MNSNKLEIHTEHPQIESKTSHSSFSPSHKNTRLSPKVSPKGQVDLSNPTTVYPILVQDKITKQKMKTEKSGSKKFDEEIEESVLEENEEQENERHFLKKIPIVADAQEFNTKRTHIDRFRGRQFDVPENIRARSVDANHLPLDKVQEAKVEEDETQKKEHLKKMDIFMDKNEFNVDSKLIKPRRYSLITEQSLPILEEQEKKSTFHKHQSPILHPTLRGRHSSHTNERNLKVDEVDIKPKKVESSDESDDEEEPIETIVEEEGKETTEAEENKEYVVAKHKLEEEKGFIKRIIKGEIIDEEDTRRSDLAAENEIPNQVADPIMEEVTEEDKSESPDKM